MNQLIKVQIAEKTKKILDIMLRIEANSASCGITYQPKVPKNWNNIGMKNDEKIGR